jgi:hypothetical protein
MFLLLFMCNVNLILSWKQMVAKEPFMECQLIKL